MKSINKSIFIVVRLGKICAVTFLVIVHIFYIKFIYLGNKMI